MFEREITLKDLTDPANREMFEQKQVKLERVIHSIWNVLAAESLTPWEAHRVFEEMEKRFDRIPLR